MTRLLLADGHDAAVSCNHGLHGQILHWDGMKLYPAGFEAWGNDVLLLHAENHFGRVHDGLVLVLFDAWVMNPDVLSQAHTAIWVPVDHDPAPPRVVDVLRESGAWPVAMSRFGERALHDAGLEPLYAPHGIDTDQYRPLDQHTCRDELKVPADAFVVGMVAANKGYPSRKGWSQAILAFAEFARHHDDALLFLHTEMSVSTGGTDLVALLQSCGLGPERVICTNPYMQIVGSDVQHMAKLYSALDVLLNPSLGEGFGVPVVEAQACGRPVIVTDHTAMTELCGSGWLVEGDRVFTDQRSWMKIPQVGSIVEALEAAYQESRSPVVRDRAREFALAYDHRAVYDTYWRPVLAELEGRMVPLELPGTNGHVELEEVAA